MKKLLLGYRDNMRVEIESDVPVTAKTVADLRALPAWPDGLVLDMHVDLDPRLSGGDLSQFCASRARASD
jgi:hypothetical protein